MYCIRVNLFLFIALSYIWYKDSFLNFIRPNVKWYTFVSSDGKLYFQFVTKDDEGNYWCLVSRPNTLDNFQEGKLSMPIPLRVTETGMFVIAGKFILI